MAKKVQGTCHICGEHGPLSYEHIPPRSLGNNAPRKSYKMADMIDKGKISLNDTQGVPYENHQQGSGKYSLCKRCNSYLGTHYVSAYSQVFVETMASFGKSIEQYDKSWHNLTQLHTKELNGLAFFKQIIATFCSLNQPGTMIDCRDFLLDKESTAFNREKYALNMYAVVDKSSKGRSTGWMKKIYTNGVVTLSEYVDYPIGFVLYNIQESKGGLYTGCNLNPLSEMKFGDECSAVLNLPIFEVDTFIPPV